MFIKRHLAFLEKVNLLRFLLFLILFSSLLSCLEEESNPIPSIWMSRKSCIIGDTIIFKDKSLYSNSRFWVLPDTSVSDLPEIIFPTQKMRSGYYYISLDAIGESELNRKNQKKLIRMIRGSHLVINYGTRIDTIVFRGVGQSHNVIDYSNILTAYRLNLFGNQSQSFNFSLYSSLFAYSNLPDTQSYKLIPVAVQPTENFPPFNRGGTFSLRGLFFGKDTGVVGAIYPKDSTGFIKIVGYPGSHLVKFDNIPAIYFSKRTSQSSDTIPILISGRIYTTTFDYIPD
jgi:hypothetical protein